MDNKLKREQIVWWDGNRINEVLFAQDFKEKNNIICVSGMFFSPRGWISDSDIQQMIYEQAKAYLKTKVESSVKNLVSTLKLEAYQKELSLNSDKIHINNGTYFLDGNFSEEQEICVNRLPVNYNHEAPKPNTWLAFLEDLLDKDDIPILQEYLGYCLIPSNKAQKMMVIIGDGGEGKSRIGLVMRSLLGSNMYMTSIPELESNKFARANLEFKLLGLDDDMDTNKLRRTKRVKTIVTAEDVMDIERKYQQSREGMIYAKLLAFSNGSLQAMQDKSHGFFRRQIILMTKDRPSNAPDDRMLIDKLRDEKEGILLWCLEGLHRLINNNYEFTESTRSKAALNDIVQESNNILPFIQSQGYIVFEPESSATSKDLYAAYCYWCEDNADLPQKQVPFISYLRQHAEKMNIKYSTNVSLPGQSRRLRGFKGIKVQIDIS